MCTVTTRVVRAVPSVIIYFVPICVNIPVNLQKFQSYAVTCQLCFSYFCIKLLNSVAAKLCSKPTTNCLLAESSANMAKSETWLLVDFNWLLLNWASSCFNSSSFCYRIMRIRKIVSKSNLTFYSRISMNE